MRRIFETIFIGVAWLAFAAPAFADANTIRIAVYGDSLTSGYQLQPEQAFPARLKRKLEEVGYNNIEVANMSVPGETTAGGLDRVNSLLVLHPDVVVLELGTNDAMRGINPGIIYQNIYSLVYRLMQANVYVVLVGPHPSEKMGSAYGSQLTAMYERIADYQKMAYYPDILDGLVGNPEMTLADGLHPSGKGVEVMVENLYRYVDAGVRARIEARQYQQEYQQQMQMPAQPVAPPSAININ